MNIKISALLAIVLFPMLAMAQGSSLTIFSEDGDKFTLFLNGAQQNSAPQGNLRTDGLTQQFYKARIVFEDPAKGSIDKSIQVTNPGTNESADIVYKIKNKDGEMKLRYYSAQPIQPNYAPPADVHVVHYGQPDQTTTFSQTTTTTTTNNTGSGSVSFGMGAGGGGGSVGITAMPDGGSVTSTTTTTTRRTTTETDNYDQQQAATTVGCRYPMDWNNFKSAKQTVEQASFEDTKLSSAQAILSANCLSTDQVVQVCQLFGFEETKLKFAKMAYPKTTDQGNYFKVSNVFSFDGSKTDLNNFIANGGR